MNDLLKKKKKTPSSNCASVGVALPLTAGLLLQQLPLAVDDTQHQQGQQHRGQSAADDRGQGHVPRAGHHRGQRHQVDPPTACKGEKGKKSVRRRRNWAASNLKRSFRDTTAQLQWTASMKLCTSMLEKIPSKFFFHPV